MRSILLPVSHPTLTTDPSPPDSTSDLTASSMHYSLRIGPVRMATGCPRSVPREFLHRLLEITSVSELLPTDSRCGHQLLSWASRIWESTDHSLWSRQQYILI